MWVGGKVDGVRSHILPRPLNFHLPFSGIDDYNAGMLISIIPVLVLVVGALVYGLSANPKVQEMGRLAFASGLLVTLFVVAKTTFRIG